MITFSDIGLSASTIEAIEHVGFKEPMPIQEKAIPILLGNHTDIVALAQTGTGKTAAFGLPLVERIEYSINTPQALILAPTRELCIQITKDIKDFSRTRQKINTLAVYGGSSINGQIKELNRGVQIIAATPGRLLDLLNRGKIDTSAISTIVLDEADELLNMGFQQDLNSIFDTLPKHYNTWLFSATMPDSVAKIARRYMNDPKRITIGTKNAGAENVRHQYVTVKSNERYTALKRLLDIHSDIYGIIFCRTRRSTNKIAEKLNRDGYTVDAIHGDLSQRQRDQVMGKFRNKNIQLLVATDVAARGIDVDDITHVINYELPDDLESYTHRSGRTGRAGKSGVSIGITGLKQKRKIRQLEKSVKQKFEKINVPSEQDVKGIKVQRWTDNVKQADASAIQHLMPAIKQNLEGLNRDELIEKMAALEFNKQPDAQPKSNKRHNSKPVSGGCENGSEPGFERFFINIGRKDKLKPRGLIDLINKECRASNINIGKIDIMGSFSFFEADANYTDKVLSAFRRKVKYRGRSVQIDVAKPR